MTTISIIGAGNMATAIGARAAAHGHSVEIMSRDAAKAQAAATQIGNGASVGEYGAKPAGDIVFLAVQYAGALDCEEDDVTCRLCAVLAVQYAGAVDVVKH